MTDFLNKKEDVLDLQLTRYGRQELVSGTFDPKMYTFHDHGVLYDIEHGRYSGSETDEFDRITKNTPYLRPQSIFNSANDQPIRQDEISDPEEIQTRYQVGTADLSGRDAPALQLGVAEGEINNFSYDSASLPNDVNNIPQLNFSASQIDITLQHVGDDERPPEDQVFRETLPNGNEVVIEEGEIIIGIGEENTPFKPDNFDVEVFEVEDFGSGEKLRRLYYREDVIEENEPFQEIYEPPSTLDLSGSLNPRFVEYYLDIETDKQISLRKLCEKFGPEGKEIFGEELECEQFEEEHREDIYRTNVDEEDVIDKC